MGWFSPYSVAREWAIVAGSILGVFVVYIGIPALICSELPSVYAASHMEPTACPC